MHPVLKEILLDVERLEPFPAVASRVLELSFGAPGEMLEEIVDVVRTDAGITTKVLRLANSVKQGAQLQITSVEHAGVHLGTRQLVNLIMTATVGSYFMGLGASTPRSNHALWAESVANALGARQIALREGYADPELAYTVGLLQNIGHMILDRFLAAERTEILGRVDSGIDMLDAERRVLGLDHAQVGARIAKRWGFPPVLVDGILRHHRPHLARVDAQLCGIANLAETLTWSVLGDDGPEALAYGVSSHTVGTVAVASELVALRGVLRLELEEQHELLSAGG